jgi:putative transposase
MPSKNTLKTYIEKSFYHVYNRGVEKRDIFLDEKDFRVFLYFLKSYLLPKEKLIEAIKENKQLNFKQKTEMVIKISRVKNFNKKIKLLCFCLMKNHYHLLIYQENKDDLELFMRALNTRYSQYFNKKYDRVGHLFQGRYKAVLIENEEQFLHISRYIHNNPKEILSPSQSLISYPWSSYPFYVKNLNVDWIEKDLILSYFKKTNGYGFSSYQGFIEGYKEKSEEESSFYKELLID